MVFLQTSDGLTQSGLENFSHLNHLSKCKCSLKTDDKQEFYFMLIKTNIHSKVSLFISGNFEKQYDDVTIKMIFAIVQIIGFSNSICNPIVYAFMNENFKKNFVSAVCYCIVKKTLSPARRRGNSGITMMQKKAMFSRRKNPVEETKGEAFSDGNIEVKLCEQPEEKNHLKRHLALFNSELSENSALGSGR